MIRRYLTSITHIIRHGYGSSKSSSADPRRNSRGAKSCRTFANSSSCIGTYDVPGLATMGVCARDKKSSKNAPCVLGAFLHQSQKTQEIDTQAASAEFSLLCNALWNRVSLRPGIFWLSGFAVGSLAWGNGQDPWRLLWIALLPLAWGIAKSRWSAALLMFGYYLGGARGLPGGTTVFFGDSSAWIGYTCYLSACLLLTLPFLLLWSKSNLGLRFVLAMMVSVVPPLAFVGWINPLAVSGALYPGMTWMGLLLSIVLLFALAVMDWEIAIFTTAIALAANTFYISPSPPAGWAAEDTHFAKLGSGVDLNDVIAAIGRVNWLVKYAGTVPANSVRVLPETILGPIGMSAKYLLSGVSADLARRGSRILVGGELNQNDGRYLNAVLNVGAQGTDDRQAVQGIPVPVSMWHPFGKSGAVADVWGHSGLVEVAGKKTGVLICYEQLLTYSVLWMMTEKPDVLVGASNLWWVTDKTIPIIQNQMMQAYGRLFGVAVVRAVNS